MVIVDGVASPPMKDGLGHHVVRWTFEDDVAVQNAMAEIIVVGCGQKASGICVKASVVGRQALNHRRMTMAEANHGRINNLADPVGCLS